MTQSVVVQGKGPWRVALLVSLFLSLPVSDSRLSPLCSGAVREPGGLPLLGPGAAGARCCQQGNGVAFPSRPASPPAFVPCSLACPQSAVFVCWHSAFTVSKTTPSSPVAGQPSPASLPCKAEMPPCRQTCARLEAVSARRGLFSASSLALAVKQKSSPPEPLFPC